ncbi:MAG TPA: S8 family serine peptidase [Thermomicrobiales bacterium]|nr:S8 family serine peptidase [Thermomicrobiales bacterium]
MGASRAALLRVTVASLRLVAALGVVCPAAGIAAGGADATPGVVAPGQLLAGFQPGVTPEEQEAVVRRHGGRTLRALPDIGARLVALPAGRAIADEALAFGAEPAVRYAEPNGIVSAADPPGDPSFGAQWFLQNTGQAIPGQSSGQPGVDIGATRAWETTTGNPDIVVGVLDTGIDFDHPDLAGNLWTLPAETALTDSRGAPCATGSHGYDAVTDRCGPDDGRDDPGFAPGDFRYGQGTHVAGVVGAVGNNGVGVAGVNWRVGLMALKVLDATGAGDAASVAAGIMFAVRARQAGVNVRVLTVGWGLRDDSKTLRDAVDAAGRAGILVVAAAGNQEGGQGVDIDRVPLYPASYAAANIVAVAATDNRDGRLGFTNYGARSVDLGAPGAGIYSTLPGGAYGYRSGTAMAAATVAGAAALILAAPGLGGLTIDQLKDRLLYCGVPDPALALLTVSGRRLDVARAIAGADCAIPPPGPGVPPSPPPGWSPWVARGGILGDAPAAAALGNRVYVFARGTGDALYVMSSAGGDFTGWQDLGGILTAAPAAASNRSILYVFAKGSDDALYAMSSTDGANWSGWTRLGGVLTAPPAAASANGVLYVLARGADGALYLTSSRDGQTYSEWLDLGGILTTAPAAAAFGGQLYVFAGGSDAALYERHSADGVTFTPWQRLGGILTAAPAAAAFQPDQGPETLYTFATGSDLALYERHTTDGATWSDWQGLGGQLVGPPAAADANGRLYAVVRWINDELYERHLGP